MIKRIVGDKLGDEDNAAGEKTRSLSEIFHNKAISGKTFAKCCIYTVSQKVAPYNFVQYFHLG